MPAPNAQIAAVFEAIADLEKKIREIVQTGRCRYLEDLRARFPAGITELLTLPGLGPKRVRALYRELGVGSLEELERAAAAGRVRELQGFGEKTEKKILELMRSRAS